MKSTYLDSEYSLLHELLNTCSPSCRENEIRMIFQRKLTENNYQVHTDILGNVVGSINSEANFKILITAHMDEVGLQITSINKNGLLFFRRVGEIELMSLCGHQVIILNENGSTEGIIGRNAQKQNITEQGMAFDISDLWIDIGAEDEKEALQKVQIGDFVSFKPNPQKIGSKRICAKGLDNKLGVFIISQVMKRLNTEKLFIGVYVAATVQEEIRLRGIAPCVHQMNPNIGFIIDVGFATDIPGVSEYRESRFNLGEGIGLIHNADNCFALTKYLTQTAKINKIPIQHTIGHSLSGGTDATILQLTANGVSTANISIPCRYMHSHSEICDFRDIDSAIQLLVSTILRINNDTLI